MTNWKVVKSGALSEQYFPRFVVVDVESGAVVVRQTRFNKV